MKMIHTILLAAALVAAEPAPDPLRAAVLEDYARFSPVDAPYIRYIRWDVTEYEQEEIEAIHAFYWPHLSRERVLQNQVPVKVAGGLYRIDLRGLAWSHDAWLRLTKAYPYRYPHVYDTLHIRGDWLLRITADTNESTLYYDLLYGVGKAPKTRDEFFKFWQVNMAKEVQAHIVPKGKSGVSHEERGMIVSIEGSETFDSANAIGPKNPTETAATGKREFDAQEVIAPIYKVDTKTGERSFAQAYLLTDGKGNRVNIADTQVVIDHTDPRGSVITPKGCIRCHVKGLIMPPGESRIREIVRDGFLIYFKDKQKAEDFEAEYLGTVTKRIERAQEDFGLLVAGYTDKSTEECVGIYSNMLTTYDANVNLETAARECHSTAEELGLAIGYWFATYGPDLKRANLGLLGQGQSVPRKAFEAYTFAQCHEALAVWRAK